MVCLISNIPSNTEILFSKQKERGILELNLSIDKNSDTEKSDINFHIEEKSMYNFDNGIYNTQRFSKRTIPNNQKIQYDYHLSKFLPPPEYGFYTIA